MNASLLPKLVLLLSLGGFVLDRALKYLALAGFTLGPEQSGVRFELLPNPAIAFSLAFPKTLSLALIPAVLLAFVYAAVRQYRQGEMLCSALLAGVVMAAGSNYLDRLQHGYVVDYVSLGNWFPVFNLSDVVIVALLVWLVAAPWTVNRGLKP